MESKESKILKVTMEFEDKTQYLEGKEAERWFNAANAACTMEAIHGREFPAFQWKIIYKVVGTRSLNKFQKPRLNENKILQRQNDTSNLANTARRRIH